MVPSRLLTNRLLRISEINDVKDKWDMALCCILGHDIRLYNPKRAYELLKSLLDDGYEFAKIPLAIMYKNGIGINKDDDKAETYWKWAADKVKDDKYTQFGLEMQIPEENNWQKYMYNLWEVINRIDMELSYSNTRSDYDSWSVTDTSSSNCSSSTIST
jgi:TPR repeat protein